MVEGGPRWAAVVVPRRVDRLPPLGVHLVGDGGPQQVVPGGPALVDVITPSAAMLIG